MIIKSIDASDLQRCFLMGAKSLEAKKEYINELNVFPVPDGDTGTNMTLTIMSAAKEVNSIENPTMSVIAKAISSGSLRGARGNSGVILSQLFRGFTKVIKEYDKIDVKVMAASFKRAVETAYKAVMKPKEGTILTVARSGAEKAGELAEETEDLVYFCKQILNHMEETLNKTPDMLSVLKEAGVVDSGGAGLLTVLKGAYEGLLGNEPDFEIDKPSTSNITSGLKEAAPVDIKFGYCTEFIIMVEKNFNSEEEKKFKGYLEAIGDSIVVVSDDDIVKVHVHTNDPGLAIQKALTYGSLTKMKIDNMREEHNEKLIKDAAKLSIQQNAAKKEEINPIKEYGFISVSVGKGIDEIFKGLGVDYIIQGGQTMNPSTEDMLNAISHVAAKNVFVLPNNKNIILAANQAKSLVKDKKIIVIETKTIPQGISAIINFSEDKSVEENIKRMNDEIKKIKTGQVTYAVRDTNIDGKEIKQNDIIGIGDKTIISVGKDIQDVTIELISNLINDEVELVSIYYGCDIEKSDVDVILNQITDKFEDIDVEVHYGGQPIYYYIISVE